MTKYREILRLTALGLSQRNIVQSIGVYITREQISVHG